MPNNSPMRRITSLGAHWAYVCLVTKCITDSRNITSEHARQILFIANTLRAHAFQLAELAPFEPAPMGLGAARAANTLIGVDREVHRVETYLFELLVAWLGLNTAGMRAKSVLYPCCC